MGRKFNPLKHLEMKKSILIALTFVSSVAVQAQDFKPWKIALHVDPNVSWMKPNNNQIEQGKTSLKFGFGIAVDKMFTANYAFGTGLNILNTGGQLTYLYNGGFKKDGQTNNTEVIGEVTRTYNLKYLEIPLTLKLRTNEIGYITYWAQFGVGIGFNIGAKADDELKFQKEYFSIPDDPMTEDVNESQKGWKDSGINARKIEENEIKDDIGLFRTSLIVGAGIEYNLSGNASLVAGVTFNNGFNNVLKGDGVATDSADNPTFTGLAPDKFKLKAINNMLMLNVGILF